MHVQSKWNTNKQQITVFKQKESCIGKACSLRAFAPHSLLPSSNQSTLPVCCPKLSLTWDTSRHGALQVRSGSQAEAAASKHPTRAGESTWQSEHFMTTSSFRALRRPWKENNNVCVTVIPEVWKAFGSRSRRKAVLVSRPPSGQVFQSQKMMAQSHLCTATAA